MVRACYVYLYAVRLHHIGSSAGCLVALLRFTTLAECCFDQVWQEGQLTILHSQSTLEIPSMSAAMQDLTAPARLTYPNLR